MASQSGRNRAHQLADQRKGLDFLWIIFWDFFGKLKLVKITNKKDPNSEPRGPYVPTGRPRGRPKNPNKGKILLEFFVLSLLVVKKVAKPAGKGKGRGRPKKNPEVTNEDEAPESGEGRGDS